MVNWTGRAKYRGDVRVDSYKVPQGKVEFAGEVVIDHGGAGQSYNTVKSVMSIGLV